MERYDIAVIGTGPAGISAAITAKVRNKNILLLGRAPYSPKIQMAHMIDNYPGLPHLSGEELGRALTEHMEQMEIAVTLDTVRAVYAMGKYFAIQAANAEYEAESVIIATGVAPSHTIKGEEEFLGRGVSYCATCDAALYRGKTVAVVSYTPKEEAEAAFLAEMSEKVLYFQLYEGMAKLPDNVEVIREKPQKVEGGLKAERLITKEHTYTVDGIFFLRESVPAAQLVPGLQMEGNHIAINRKCESNLQGCFACGDITGTPYQYIKAAGEGNIAALSAVSFLDKKQINEKRQEENDDRKQLKIAEISSTTT